MNHSSSPTPSPIGQDGLNLGECAAWMLTVGKVEEGLKQEHEVSDCGAGRNSGLVIM